MYALVRPLLFAMDPEKAHNLVFGTLRALGPLARGVSRLVYGPPDPRLKTRVAGLDLAGPIGLAAGLDKNGVLARFWPTVGFGFVELGTVTALAQAGNPRPRMFRFPAQRALINRMGFNNRGSLELAGRLGGIGRLSVPCGVNLGKSKVTPLEEAATDYETSTKRVVERADYLVINVSSPNTPGLRKLQDASFLTEIVKTVVAAAARVPVFVKLAPDLTEDALAEAVGVAEDHGAAGIIATNTTIERHGLPDVGAGGLSGAPLRDRSRAVIAFVAQKTRLPVVGVGGVASADDALALIAAGAEAVQVYSALIFEGPGLVSRINRGIVAAMEKHGVNDFESLKGALRQT